jgi:regulatory protein
MTKNELPSTDNNNDAKAYKEARDFALRHLGRRECSTQSLRRRIVQHGTSSDVADVIVEDLAKISYVDDERFSKMLIRQQVSQLKGPRFIRQKLREQGINLSAAQVTAISSEVTDTTEVETARNLVERKYPKAWDDKKIAARASQALLRRGFSYDIISAVLRSRETPDL